MRMRELFKSTSNPAPLPMEPLLHGMAKQAAARHYRDGLADGMSETLDQLEGRSKLAQGRTPELTEDVRDWIAECRARLDQVRAEDGRGQ